MKTIHLKSPCCGAKSHKRGRRRRSCSKCGKFWTIRKKRRGRKQIRVHADINQTVVERGESLRHKAKRVKKGRELVRRRHETNLNGLVKQMPLSKAPKGYLVAVADAMTTHADGEKYTIFLILLRAVDEKVATVMEPLVRRGHETTAGWREALGQLREEDRSRVKALVSDGFKGFKLIAREEGWLHQRCHFHLLKTLQSLRGNRWRNVKNKKMREEMYQLVLKILVERNEKKVRRLTEKLKDMASDEECPKWIGLRVRGFLKEVEEFRTYIHCPKLNLPTTTNSAETTVNLISEMIRSTRGFKTHKSLEKWVKIKVRNLKKIQCNGNKNVQN